ncbi:hypothetical protein B296_00057785 [Ensete ventricosum]|uniref:Uncharacterized protein n=1 Tax=Ensete ventricosum TaxID=4639 RepID=A0A426XLA1_ENSVE|nr:hypothetical protein B296_00057785 [Ensete ventricosum]
MTSTPSLSVSSFSSSLSSLVPPSREERHRSNDSSGNQSVPKSSSSGVMTRAKAKVLQALEVMKSLHDFDSTICLEYLRSIWKRFSIPNEYVLHAPRSGQRPYHPCPGGFGISIDALEVGLRYHCLDSRGSLQTSPTPALVRNFMTWWYVETTALSLLSVGLPMMALYAEGSAITMNDTNSVFDLGSSPTVTGRAVVPAGETESPVNPVRRRGLGKRRPLLRR